MKKKNIFSYLSIITLIAGAAAGIYALAKIFIIRAALPPGACPIDNNRPLIYIAIALCAVSFIFTLLEQWANKRAAKQDG